MNIPKPNICMLSYLITIVLIVLFLCFSFTYSLDTQVYFFTDFSWMHRYLGNTNKYLLTTLVHLDLALLPIDNQFNDTESFRLTNNYLKNEHKEIYIDLYPYILNFTYATFLLSCCFFILINKKSNISLIAISVGGHSPPTSS